MPTLPNRLQEGTNLLDAYALINNNFDNAVKDLSDLGATTSSTLLTSFTIGAGTLTTTPIALVNASSTTWTGAKVTTVAPMNTVTNAQPLLDIYIDNDNTTGYYFPGGANLSAGALGCFVTLSSLATTPLGTLAAFNLQINNRDTVSHVYYVHFKCTYLAGYPTGAFR